CAPAPPRRRERARAAGEPWCALPCRLPDRGRGLPRARRPDPRRGAASRGMGLTPEVLEPVVRAALAEDVGSGDVTTDSVVPADARCRATLELEEPGVVCGVPAVRAVFKALAPDVTVEVLLEEGTRVVDVPARVATIEGPARAILTGERTALNLFGRLCGIA